MVVYFECFSGISGDMAIASLIDLGVPLEYLSKEMKSILNISISAKKILKNGIMATSLSFESSKRKKNLNYKDIKNLIGNSTLQKDVKNISLNIFEEIASAESHIHNKKKEEIHFHEIGSVDTIFDIVGFALSIKYLKIEKIFASKIPFSKGYVKTHHGKLPSTAPATLEILRGVPMYDIDIAEEIVTPTGAAIIKSSAESFGEFPDMEIESVGYGAGDKEFKEMPNLLRVVIGKESSDIACEKIVTIETTIDDMSPEIYGFVMEKLFEKGALDVYFIPIFMKKNRPAVKIEVLSTKEKKDILIETLLSETTSLGIRYYDTNRKVVERCEKKIETKFGEVRVKIVKRPNQKIETIPEYEECKKIAIKKNIPLRTVYNEIFGL